MKSFFAASAALFSTALACNTCYGPASRVDHVRLAKRIQPGAPEATYGPTRPLEWGQVNFLHTTDTHGWLSGHLKEANYGADFGDFISFSLHMKQQAKKMGVDLLLVDTGDLHDGTGLSDTTSPDGILSNPVFEQLKGYDLLTIGNHELYVAEVAYDTFNQFSAYWGEKYLTSNVQIYNTATSTWDYIGQKYRYFTTENGLRVLAFGILFDFTGNANVSKVIPAATMVKQDWFTEVINDESKPVDLFLLIGHNIARPATSGSTFPVVHEAIRAAHPSTPIQIFGGHSHIRDFAVVDESSTALEAGRYCETVGWLSMSGFDKSNSGLSAAKSKSPRGVPNPTRKAVANSTSPFTYARRYLDWNRYTFQYHSIESEKGSSSKFDCKAGLKASADITAIRTEQRLGEVYGCVPEFYCSTCVPFTNDTNIFTLLSKALAEVVVNTDRADKSRMIFANTGSVRFDMHKGPFTYDDNYIVSPFNDIFLYIPDVPYADAQNLLTQLNGGGADKRSIGLAAASEDTIFGRSTTCVDPTVGLARRDGHDHGMGAVRRQVQETSGYTTSDDFGTDGDDTEHVAIPSYTIPNYFGAEANFPESGTPETVDVVFFDFIESYILSYLGDAYDDSMVTYYISENFTAQDYLLPYVENHWAATNLTTCSL